MLPSPLTHFTVAFEATAKSRLNKKIRLLRILKKMIENRTPFIAYHPDYLPKLPKSTGFPLENMKYCPGNII